MCHERRNCKPQGAKRYLVEWTSILPGQRLYECGDARHMDCYSLEAPCIFGPYFIRAVTVFRASMRDRPSR
ncbi:hypothetical protein HN873_033408, partial [Arachis hypogaea]